MGLSRGCEEGNKEKEDKQVDRGQVIENSHCLYRATKPCKRRGGKCCIEEK